MASRNILEKLLTIVEENFYIGIVKDNKEVDIKIFFYFNELLRIEEITTLPLTADERNQILSVFEVTNDGSLIFDFRAAPIRPGFTRLVITDRSLATRALKNAIEIKEIETDFIDAVLKFIDAVEKSDNILIKNPLILSLIKIFKEINQARIKIQKNPNDLALKMEEQDTAIEALSDAILLGNKIFEVKEGVEDSIGKNVFLSAVDSLSTELLPPVINSLTNITPQLQAIFEPITRTTIKSSLLILRQVFKNTDLYDPIKELFDAYQRAEAFRDRLVREEGAGGGASAASSQTPSNGVITGGISR